MKTRETNKCVTEKNSQLELVHKQNQANVPKTCTAVSVSKFKEQMNNGKELLHSRTRFERPLKVTMENGRK